MISKKEKKSSIFLLTFLQSLFTLTLFLFTNSQQKICKKFICGDLPNNLCLLETNNDSNVNFITGKICEENKFCPLLNFYNFGNSTCIEKPKEILKQFPGGPCKNPDNCFSDKCEGNICIGTKDGEICDTNDECNFNKACYLLNGKNMKTCNDLKNPNEKCLSDFECKMNSGCFKGFCTPYFSLQNEFDVSSSSNKNAFSFCKSGYSYNGFCLNLINLNNKNETTDDLVPCNIENKCFYKSSSSLVNTTNNILVLDNVCDNCGKSKDGKIYCPIFGGNKLFKRYVDYLNSTINNPEIIGVCNTNERKGICNYHKQNPLNSDKIKTFIDTINTYQIRQRDFQTFANSEDCILKIFNEKYNKEIDNPIDPVPTDEKKCPIFKCDFTPMEDKKICANKIFDVQKKQLNISLFENSCRWNLEICNFDGNYNTTNTEESLCKSFESIGKKYPGENCEKNEDCYAEEKTEIFGICANRTKICLGKNLGETCAFTSQCNKGLYCKKGELSSKCETQLSKGKVCESSYDCKNNLGCFNNTCNDVFFTLKLGDEINNNFDPEIPREIFCESQMIMRTDNTTRYRCAKKNHKDFKNSTIDDLVICNYNQMCNYTLTNNFTNENLQESCTCGYNKDGFGYCPRGHDAGKVIFLYIFFIIFL
jgi:hypothetical protein